MIWTFQTNMLTDTLKCIPEDIQFPSLEVFNLSCTKLSRADVTKLSQVLTGTNSPRLKKLILSGNVLTDCMKNLLGNSEAIFSSLKQLNLKDTQLNGADMQCLAEVMRHNQLPVLQLLRLHTTERDSLVYLFGNSDDHPEFTSQEGLSITSITLSGEDFISLSKAIQCGKLYKLRRLSLEPSDQNNVKKKLKALKETCKQKGINVLHI